MGCIFAPLCIYGSRLAKFFDRLEDRLLPSTTLIPGFRPALKRAGNRDAAKPEVPRAGTRRLWPAVSLLCQEELATEFTENPERRRRRLCATSSHSLPSQSVFSESSVANSPTQLLLSAHRFLFGSPQTASLSREVASRMLTAQRFAVQCHRRSGG